MKGFTSRAVHFRPPRRDPHGSLRTPIYDSVAFEFETSRDIELAFAGKKAAHAYSRITNPTVEDFELRVHALSGGTGVLALSSGMAAVSNVVLALAGAGTNIVSSKHLFGNTRSLFDYTLGPWGLSVRYVDMGDPEAVRAAVDQDTRLIFTEIISNPRLSIPDVRGLSAISRERRVPLVLDTTVTTPYLFRAGEYGAAVEVISSTKYISGGATAVGGLIIDHGAFDWSGHPALSSLAVKTGPFAFLTRLRREVFRNLGACLSPHNAWLQSLGLETLSLRVEKSSANALAVARFLEGHGRVRAVNYPGLPSSPWHTLAREQFQGRFGGILTFTLADKASCFRFMDRLAMVRRSTNLNDNKTLVLHPASTIFSEWEPGQRSEMGAGEGLIRLSVGIEDAEDIIEDLSNGLEA